jgi:EAL domain-containing protein (putative c-di-GMP-specific phosphodiesterase class I)/GGDEF domain-containing protein
MNTIAWDHLPVDATHDTVEELDAILRGWLLRTHFQPIFRTRDLTLLGWEALTRGPAGSPLESPGALFTLARRTGKLHKLDYACREVAISSFAKQRQACPTGKLFLNVEPTALIDGMRSGQTVEMLAANQLLPTQVVIELTEASPHLSFDLLRAAVDHYRSQGFEIAIDDLGEGYASLRLWAEIRPDYVKIDRHFIHRAPVDPTSRRLLELMIGLSEQIGCTIIAEGVEEAHEWQLLAQLGVDAVQGFLLSRPAPELVPTLPEALRQSLQNKITSRNGAVADHTPTAATLAVLIPPVIPETDNETVFRRFISDRHIAAVPVVDHQNQPLGIILRSVFMEDFSRPYRHELFGRRSCLHYRQPVRTVPAATTIHELSRLFQSVPLSELGHPFVVVDEAGRYLGVGDGQMLLRTLIDMQLEAARYANPLSGLPGNVIINQTIDRYLAKQCPFVVTYIDISHFKAYNDIYGFSRGDEMIRLIADLLRRTVQHPDDFIGHIGGDDFIVLWTDPEWEARIASLFTAYTNALPSFYSPEDWQAGGFQTEDRQGNVVFHPVSALTVGALHVLPECYPSYHAVAASAAEAKKMAKKESARLAAQGIVPANALFIERRQPRPPCHQGVTSVG